SIPFSAREGAGGVRPIAVALHMRKQPFSSSLRETIKQTTVFPSVNDRKLRILLHTKIRVSIGNRRRFSTLAEIRCLEPHVFGRQPDDTLIFGRAVCLSLPVCLSASL
ncbi:unnamed protein product, partial [Ectocarpus sp. 12 AP-2014]